MGYDLHIRRGDWGDPEPQPITLDEWLAVVASDPHLTLTHEISTTLPDGTTIRLASGRGDVRWENPGQVPTWFRHIRDEVEVTKPDVPAIVKAVQLAGVLGARVFGDDGEQYAADGAALPFDANE